MAIQQQVHDRFKVFVGASIEDLGGQVAAFTADAKVAAKSIGVEYLEAKGRLLLSLGYRDGDEGYAATLASRAAGALDLDAPDSIARLESALSEFADGIGDVICHELYVTDAGEVHIVFLSKA